MPSGRVPENSFPRLVPAITSKGRCIYDHEETCAQTESQVKTGARSINSNFRLGNGGVKTREESGTFEVGAGKAKGIGRAANSPVRFSPITTCIENLLIEMLVTLGGGEFIAVQEAVYASNREIFPASVYFNSPVTHSTLVLPATRIAFEGAALVRRHISEDKAKFEARQQDPPDETLVLA